MMVPGSPNDTSSSFLLQTQLDALRQFNSSKRQALVTMMKDETVRKPELISPSNHSTVKILNNYRRMLSQLRNQTHQNFYQVLTSDSKRVMAKNQS